MEGIYMNKKEQFLGQKHGVEIKVYALFSPGQCRGEQLQQGINSLVAISMALNK